MDDHTDEFPAAESFMKTLFHVAREEESLKPKIPLISSPSSPNLANLAGQGE